MEKRYPETPSGLTLISSQTLTAVGSPLLSIPQTYRHLQVVFHGRGNTSAASDTLALRFNGDATNQYSYQHETAVGATGQAYMQIGDIPAATASAPAVGFCIIDIPHYTGTTWKPVFFRGGYSTTTTANHLANFGFGQWMSTAAITSITLLGVGSGLAIGSTIQVYGVI